jgi:hypothetical protein
MKTIEEVLRMKQEEILRVRKEVEALRIAVNIMSEIEKGSTAEEKVQYRQLLQMP